MDYGVILDDGLSYREFLQKYADDEQNRRWENVYKEVSLSDSQKGLLQSFKRAMKVLVTAGTWCGDCVNQCPILARFAEENTNIQIRYFDRDDNPELAKELSICGAPRVPSVLFLSEDNHVCGRYGDRTLSKYRQMAGDQLGAACPTGLIPPERSLLQNVTQEWLNEFERIQLMLRTSGRLRELHGD